jgi:pimeloyl-ACP methyl ester carboxylesterase
MATFLLMHGGGMGGWTWKFVREILEAKGHKVFTPTFTGFGERSHLIGRDVGVETHVTDIVNVLHYEDLTDVILVAHSYAGTVAPGVVAQAGERIKRVIYLDAIIPYKGERIASLLGFASEADMIGLDAMLDAGDGPIGSGVHEQQRAMAKEHPHMMMAARPPVRPADARDVLRHCGGFGKHHPARRLYRCQAHHHDCNARTGTLPWLAGARPSRRPCV